MSEGQEGEICRKYQEDRDSTAVSLAEEYGVSKRTIYYVLENGGVERKGKQGIKSKSSKIRKKYNTNQFFEYAKKNWAYTGHEKHPEVVDRVNELVNEGVKVPVAAILACEENYCPLSERWIHDRFGVKLKEITEAREKFGIEKKDPAEMVASVLVRRELAKEYDEVLGRIRTLVRIKNYKGTPRSVAVRAGYDYLKEIGMEINQAGYCKVFGVSEPTLRNAARK